ncbi:MAG: hypothetical protein WDZ91_07785, partial [Paenibacillaceae bacterium]
TLELWNSGTLELWNSGTLAILKELLRNNWINPAISYTFSPSGRNNWINPVIIANLSSFHPITQK